MPSAAEPGQRTRYVVRDRSGTEIATHIKIVNPDGTKRFIWVDSEGRISQDSAVRPSDLPLYAIERVNGPQVVITEGEKACDALWALGIVAVGTVTGASSTPSRESLAELTGLRVYLWADNDETGTNHMLRVAESLKGIASSVAWIVWPDAPTHGDAADLPPGLDPWDLIALAVPVPSKNIDFGRKGLGYVCRFPVGQIEMSVERLRFHSGELKGELTIRSDHPEAKGDGHILQSSFNLSSDETRKRLSTALKEKAPKIACDWREYLEVFCRKVLAEERAGQPIVLAGGRKSVEVRSIEYELYPLLPKGRPTLLFGPPAAGKSYLCAAVLVAYSTGRTIGDLGWRLDGKPGRVLVLDYEDEQDTWDRRVALIAAGLGIDPPSYFYTHPTLALTEESEHYARFCDDQDIGLVIVDSVGMASPNAHEGMDANDTALRLFKAVSMIRRTALLVDHVTKEDAGQQRARGPYGSQYKTAMARQSWEVRRMGDDTDDGDYSYGHLAVYDAKRNNTGVRPPMGVLIKYAEDAVRLCQEPLEDTVRRSGMSTRDQIWEVLVSGSMPPHEIAELTGISQGNVRTTLLRMTTEGKLVRLETGDYARRARQEEQP